MTEFERIAKRKRIKCDICGEPMMVLPGGGWDNDRVVCTDGRECGAEIVFPTSLADAALREEGESDE